MVDKICTNKKASYEYEFIEQITAGIKLFGSEIKSIRNHKVSISESYVYIKNGEVYIKGMHISEYKQSGIHTNHEPTRLRKLLLNKREILKFDDSIQQKGLTIVPISVIINNKGLVKIEIALCRGKKIHDKRNDLKDKDIKREIDRELNIKF
jgi:SsrA-binding protein